MLENLNNLLTLLMKIVVNVSILTVFSVENNQKVIIIEFCSEKLILIPRRFDSIYR